VIATLTLISVVGHCYYFFNLNYNNSRIENPYFTYDNNIGIIAISIALFVLKLIFLSVFLPIAFDKFLQEKYALAIYIFSALSIAILQWYELYYGSTFYYGEVRDKQGLSFPFLASFMVTLSLWKIYYSKSEIINFMIKIIFTIVINIALYFLWTQVYKSWNLWQS